MKEFRLSRYMKKWLPLILVVCLVLALGIYAALSVVQTYVASAVIHYTDPAAAEGLTPSGDVLDENELKSSAILSKVIDNLDLEGDYSVDDLISRISIYDVEDNDETTRKEALLEEGEEYTIHPTTFVVTFAAKSSESPEFAREVLDEILDLYFADYSEKYINKATVTDKLSGIYHDNYDYIEMLELIDAEVTETINTLYGRVNSAPYYRSTATGMTFQDLINEFEYLQSVNISKLFAQVFENQITRDKQVLLSEYANRVNNNNVSNQAEEEMISDVLYLIDAYVTKMRNSGNTNITYEYILEQVHDRERLDSLGDVVGSGDQTVTYDKLIYAWRDHSEAKQHAIIDSAYCNYIMNIFSESTCGDPECVVSSLTCSARNNPEYAALEQKTDESIRALVDELNGLYQLTNITNQEYNEYQGAANIAVLSSIAVTESINVLLYTIIAAVFLLIICGCGAIALGRMSEILHYIFHTDHMTGLSNRAAFDAYLKDREAKLLDDGYICATVSIKNQVEINKALGREKGDELIKLFASMLKDVFRKTGAEIFYNGNASFILMAENSDYVTAEQILRRFRQMLDSREVLTEAKVVYEMGIAESYQNDIHRIRGLLTEAFGHQNTYTSEAAAKKI